MSRARVPFLDLNAHHAPIRDEIMAAIAEVVESHAFAGGPFVRRFEDEFAAYCGSRHCVGVSSGTDALWLTLLALGIGEGDEVVTVPMTFMATAEAISRTGAKPVFADINAETYTMDPSALEAAISPRTKAIIPVHLFGHCADMEAITAIARRRNLFVLEDAAQAAGSTYRGRRAGGLGTAAAFSFYPGKNLGAWGEAGAVTTDDADLARRIRVFRDHGQTQKYRHEVVGWNGRMDGIQAAVLKVKLSRLDVYNLRRRAVAQAYNRHLSQVGGIELPKEHLDCVGNFHLYVIQVDQRDALLAAMKESGVDCGVHYPTPVHLQPAYAYLGHCKGDFSVSENCAERFLSLPIFPELTDVQVEMVTGALKACLAKRVGVAS